MQVAVVNGGEATVEEIEDGAVAGIEPEEEQFDEILAVQHWAMQTADWKLLNVLIELVDQEQLQYKCKNGDTIFEVFAHLLQLALWKPYAGPTYQEEEDKNKHGEQTATTQVRNFIMAYLLPYTINKSLPFLSAGLTISYLELFDQAMDIELHLRDSLEAKEYHMAKIQTMHQQLIDGKGVMFDAALLPRYQQVFSNFSRTFSTIRSEKLKQNGLFILRMYIIEYHRQLISPLADAKE